MGKTTVPAIAGWFTTDEKPTLLGSECKSCGTYTFPKETLYCKNPSCQSSEFSEIPLSRTGTIWSFSEHFYKPPDPYVSADPFEPYTIAAVELEREKMVVLGQVAKGVKSEDLAAGQQVELVVEPLYEDDEHEYTMWKWKPVEGANG
jgi:uncharacterized OB-fold protein